MNATMKIGLIVAITSALSACGGGGGNSDSSTTSTSGSSSSSYLVSGTVSGANGSLALSLNGGVAQSVAGSGSFGFNTGLSSGATYVVMVSTPPKGETCSISNGTGTVGSANVSNVTVTCSVPFNNGAQTNTYSATSFQSGFFATINAARQAIGVGELSQKADLDTAAQAHATYLAVNYNPSTMSGTDASTGLPYAHSENSGNPDFYGSTPWDRDSAAGYTVQIFGEVVGPTYGGTVYDGDEGARAMLNSVYHRQTVLLDTYRNIGIGVNPASNAHEQNGYYVSDVGGVDNAQALPAGTIAVYPTSGATNASPYFSNASESPSPLASQGALNLGGPISVQARSGDTLTVTSFTLTDSDGNDVPVSLLDASTDTTGEMLSNFAVILPNAPLIPGATYTASFSGMDGSTAVSKTWSFITLGSINVVTQGPYVVHNGNTLLIQAVIPSGFAVWSDTSSLSNSQYSIAMVGSESLQVTIPSGAVSAEATIQLTVKDNELTSVPPVTITVTVEP